MTSLLCAMSCSSSPRFTDSAKGMTTVSPRTTCRSSTLSKYSRKRAVMGSTSKSPTTCSWTKAVFRRSCQEAYSCSGVRAEMSSSSPRTDREYASSAHMSSSICFWAQARLLLFSASMRSRRMRFSRATSSGRNAPFSTFGSKSALQSRRAHSTEMLSPSRAKRSPIMVIVMRSTRFSPCFEADGVSSAP